MTNQILTMKKLKITFGVLILLSVFSTLFLTKKESEAYNYAEKFVTTAPVEKMDLSQTFTYSAILEGNRETVLSAKMTGQISTINFDIGDKVGKGALIASLSGNEHYARSKAAADYYKNAQITRDVTNLLTEKQIEDARAALKTAEKNLNIAKIGLSGHQKITVEKLKTAELEYEKAQTQLENIERQFSQQEKNAWQARETTIVNAAILNKNLLNNFYTINEQVLPDLSSNFQISDVFIVSQQLKHNARDSIRAYKAATNKLESFYNSEIKGKSPNKETLLEGDKLAKETIEQAKIALQDMTEILNSSFNHSNLTQSKLDSYRAGIQSYATQIQTLSLSQQDGIPMGITGIEQLLNNLNVEKQNQLTNAEKQLRLAEENVNLTESTLQVNEEELKARVEISMAQLNQAKNALETIKAQAAHQQTLMQTQVDAAQGEMNIAGAIASNTRITAPFSGVIAEKYLDEGAMINPGTPVLKIADISRLKLALYIPESQIRFFNIGQTGVATTENFPGKEFNLSVEKIAPQVDPENRKIRVEFRVENPDPRFKLGMFMTVKMNLNNQDQEQVLAIPLSSIQNYYEEPSVFILENGRAKRQIIKTGITGDTHTEVIEGLNENDIIITKGLDALRDGDKVTTKNNG